MIVLNRWHVIIVAAIVSLLFLAQVAHQNEYDTDVLRMVNNVIDKDGKSQAKNIYKTSTPTPVERTVTVTHTQTETAPTVTETQTITEGGECPEKEAIWAQPYEAFNHTFEVPANIKYDPKGPRSDQIVILTATDGRGHNEAIHDIVNLALDNRDRYAKYHGYNHHFINISKYDIRDMHPVWKKLPAIVETFNTYPDAQWILWLDLDAIIMTPKQDLQSLILSKEGMRKSFLPGAQLMDITADKTFDMYWPREPDFENVDLIMAQDAQSLNAGSFLMRRSQFTQWLLDMWADPLFMYASFELREQDALVHMMKHHPMVRKHTGIARQRSINAFSVGPDWMEWHTGDLLVHFAGCWTVPNCQEQWDLRWAQREKLDDE